MNQVFKKQIGSLVLAFENDEDRASNYDYYLPNVEIKDYNIMINGENFFDQSIKKVTYENIRKTATGQGDDYTTLDRTGNTRVYFILEEAKETILGFSEGTVKVL